MKKLIIVLALLMLVGCATNPQIRKELDCRELTVKKAQNYYPQASEAHWSVIIENGFLRDYYENCLNKDEIEGVSRPMTEKELNTFWNIIEAILDGISLFWIKL